MELTKKEKQKRILMIFVYYLIAVAVRYATNKTHLLDDLPISFLKTVLKGTGPAIGAFMVFCVFNYRGPMTLKGSANSLLVPLTVFWIIPIMALTAVLFLETGQISTVALSILVYALFEEVGWRGFLQPALSFLPKIFSILVITLMWFVWHLNFDWSFSNLIFLIVLLTGSWGMMVVSNKTHSLLAVSAFHAIYDIYSAINISSALLNTVLILCFISWLGYTIWYDRFKSIGSQNNWQVLLKVDL